MMENTECKAQLVRNLKFKLSRLKIIFIAMSLKYPLYMEDQGTICLVVWFLSFQNTQEGSKRLSHIFV